LLDVINKLVESGNTVIVIEHNMDVVRNADWVIDLGPEGGSRGGEVIFEGTPADLKKARRSITSRYV
jgi:excinuclease UvrABC ATPase subunit